ncbi:hypothetical protein AVEN_93640-1 [Araneus ventricosus]|uniref:Histone-lysine N-methyltransferase SETMAR n=1 Tax=Araneus ventricosus TaxID=182803 RepID=A0A4Y2UQF6_ARAVE|nr:hypothetical protein AVEN_93640-1 [Araneus ventricosus]
MMRVPHSLSTPLTQGKSTSGDVLIHDNARPHGAVVTQQLLEQFKCDISDHPAHSPDLATSDFHLFPEFRNWLGGQSFQKNEEIQSIVKGYPTSLVQHSSKRGSQTCFTDMINTRIFTAIMSKSNYV